MLSASSSMSRMVVTLRWVWTATLRVGSFVSHSRWIILSVVLATTGVVAVAIPLPAALNIGLAILSAFMVVLEVRTQAAKLRELEFVNRLGDAYADVRNTLNGNSRFEFLAADVGSCVIDHAASEAIGVGQVEARIASANYRIPHELRDAGVAFRRRRLAEGATYNGHVLGLNTNLGTGSELSTSDWDLVPGRYWDHLATDILATKEVLHNGLLSPISGRQFYVDRHGGLRDFADSWLLNAIGTSVLALTTDARVVLVAQSNRNESSQGLLAPSGSGSLETQDMNGKESLMMSDLAANGALREMAEEVGITADDVVETAFLGFGRWLAKAAKPELFTLAVLSVDSHAVRRRRVPSTDRPYSLGAEVIRLKRDIGSWNARSPASVLETSDPHRLSIPVHLGLRLIQHAIATENSRAGALVGTVLSPTGRR